MRSLHSFLRRTLVLLATAAAAAGLAATPALADSPILYVGDTSGVHGATATLAALAAGGDRVTFTLGSTTCSAIADELGLARCDVRLDDAAGDYVVGVATPTGTTTGGFTIRRAPSHVAVSFATSATTSRLSATLTDDGGAPLVGRPITLSIGVACVAVTDVRGVASCTVPTPGGTSALASASFAGDASYLASQDAMFVTLQLSTTLTYVGVTSSDFGDATTLTAHLATVSGVALPDKTVTLSLLGATCEAATNAVGDAACTIATPGPAGTYDVLALFAGEGIYGNSNATASYVVTKEQTVVTTTFAATTLRTPSTMLTARLLEDGSPIGGRVVTLSLGTSACNATSDANGVVSCGVAPATLGPTAATASFGGDAYYASSRVSVSTMLYANAANAGAFVIGDATTTGTVTYWGSQWSKSNTLSAGNAPTTFKGFASFASTSCNASWGIDTGNSAPPPSTPLPTYMAVVVAGTFGSTAHVVVVRTDPGYDGSPGHAGTGTVVATVC